MNKYIISFLTIAMISSSMNIYAMDGSRSGAVMPEINHDTRGYNRSLTLDEKLDAAVSAGDVEQVKNLIAQGANANKRNYRGLLPLQQAYYKRLIIAISQNDSNENILSLLKEGGKELLNAQRGLYGNTLLQEATKSGNKRIVELLLQLGAKPSN